MPGSSLSTVQSARTSSHVYCALLLSIDVCSGPPRFVTLIACISIQCVPGAQYKMESNWTPRRYAETGEEGRGKQTRACLTAGREQRNHHTVHGWSNSPPLSSQNRLRLISDAWIRISKGWKTNTNSYLKFEVCKSELHLTTLVLLLCYF